jgi:D-3-phosphoglycerate dehydrogenase / 2-oxoglutarate reductase
MIKILANDGIDQDGKLLLDEAGYFVETNKIPQNDLPQFLPEYDVIIVRSATQVRKDLIDLCPNLKIIARGGVGLDNIDVEYAQSKGITVINTPAASSQSVAELTFGHMFNLARFLHLSNRDMPTKGISEFKKLKSAFEKGTQLRGKTLGIIGFGRIGQETARIGIALGMKVMPVDVVIDKVDIDINVYNSTEAKLSVHVPTFSMEEVLPVSDFISLHIPFSGGKPVIGKEEIEKMKSGVCLINTARGGAIDETALLEALDSGKVMGAGLDVFENEPTPNIALLNHPRISVSPHIGASTIEAQAKIGLELAERILSYFGGDQ